jgi:cell division protein FtsA
VGSLLIDIGAETVSTAIFENDNLISLKVFEIGSSNITNDIALGLQVQLDEAEKIKREGSREYTQKKIDTIIEARLSDIYELVEQHLKKVKRAGLLPAGAIVSGGGAALPIIETFTKMSLHLPATVVDQQSVQQLTQKKLSDPAWLLAHGLCFLESSGSSIQVNRSSFKLFKRIRQGLRRFGEQFMP